MMAPTEILAEQHYRSFKAWFEPLGIDVARLAGKLKGKARLDAKAAIADGRARMVVGTHALFQDDVHFQCTGAGDHRRTAPLWRAPAPRPA